MIYTLTSAISTCFPVSPACLAAALSSNFCSKDNDNYLDLPCTDLDRICQSCLHSASSYVVLHMHLLYSMYMTAGPHMSKSLSSSLSARPLPRAPVPMPPPERIPPLRAWTVPISPPSESSSSLSAAGREPRSAGEGFSSAV